MFISGWGKGDFLRAAIFIDGGYFFNHIKTERGAPDYGRLANYLLAPLRKTLPVDLLRAYFYYCAPWMSEEPTEDELRRMDIHRALVDSIERTSRWQVKLGKLERRWEKDGEYFEQKRVDVLLSVDLVRHAAAKHIQHAVIVAGDSDFIPAIVAAKDAGVTVSLWTGPTNTAHKDLTWAADEFQRFDWQDFEGGIRAPLRSREPVKAEGRRPASSGGRRPRRGGSSLSPNRPKPRERP